MMIRRARSERHGVRCSGPHQSAEFVGLPFGHCSGPATEAGRPDGRGRDAHTPWRTGLPDLGTPCVNLLRPDRQHRARSWLQDRLPFRDRRTGVPVWIGGVQCDVRRIAADAFGGNLQCFLRLAEAFAGFIQPMHRQPVQRFLTFVLATGIVGDRDECIRGSDSKGTEVVDTSIRMDREDRLIDPIQHAVPRILRSSANLGGVHGRKMLDRGDAQLFEDIHSPVVDALEEAHRENGRGRLRMIARFLLGAPQTLPQDRTRSYWSPTTPAMRFRSAGARR